MRTVIILVLALGAGAALLLDQQGYTPGLTRIKTDSHDAWIEDMTLRVLNIEGESVYRMTARHMVRYPDSDRVELTGPLVKVTRPDGTVWRVSAEHGETTTGGNQIWLRGAVNIERQSGNKRGVLHISTRDVLVKPAEKMAETEHEALIISAGYRLEAVGLKADFMANRLELRSRVRGRINGAG